MAWVVSAAAAASILLFATCVLWLLVGSLRFPAPPMAQDSPAAGALGASALLLVLLSLPRGARSGAEEPLAWLLALGVLGIGACYGRFLL